MNPSEFVGSKQLGLTALQLDAEKSCSTIKTYFSEVDGEEVLVVEASWSTILPEILVRNSSG